MPTLWPTLLLMLACVAWGWSFVGVKDAVTDYDPMAFLAVRFLVAAAVLLPFAARRFTRRVLVDGSVIGASLAATFLFQTYGLRGTTSTNAGLITGLFVVFTPLVDWIMFRIRVGPAVVVAMALSLSGMFLLTGHAPGGFTGGDFLVLLAAAASGFHISLMSRHAAKHDPLALAAVQVLVCAVAFAACAPLAAPLTAPSAAVWKVIAIVALFSTAAAFAIQSWAQQRISAARAAIICALEPFFAVVFGFCLHDDRLNGWQWLGAGLILLALVVGEGAPQVRTRSRTRAASRARAALPAQPRGPS